MGTEIVFFLFGLLAIVPTCLLAMHSRQPRTLHVHHWHHTAGPQTLQAGPEARYAVLADSNSVDYSTAHTCAITGPLNRDGDK